MSYTLKQNWLPESKYSLKAPYTMTPEYVAIHETGNNASADNESKYMISNNNETSFHVVIDNASAVECIPFSRNAWHAGDGPNGTGNRKAISIEIAYQTGPDTLYKESVDNAIDYVADVLKQFGWGVDRLRRHKDFNGKDCPRGINHGRYLNWEQFKNAVQAKLQGQQNSDDQVKPGKKWFEDAIGKKYGDEVVLEAYEKTGTWKFGNIPNNKGLSIYPDYPEAMKDEKADTVFYYNGEYANYWAKVKTDKHTYIIYTRDSGKTGCVSISDNIKGIVYGNDI